MKLTAKERRKRRFWRAYLVLAALVVAITAVLAARTARNQRRQLLQEQRDQAIATVEGAAAPVHFFLAAGDVDSVRQLVHEMARERPDIASGLVAAWSGKVIADSESRREGTWVFDLLPPPSATVTRTVYRDHDPAALEVTLPLRFGEMEHGSLRVEVKLAPLKADLVSPTLPFVGGALVLLTLAAVALGLVTRARPLAHPPSPRPAAPPRRVSVKPLSAPAPSWLEMSALLEALPLAVLVIDESAKKIRYFNRHFCALWGFPERRAAAGPTEPSYEQVVRRCRLPRGPIVATDADRGIRALAEGVREDEIVLDTGRTIRCLSAEVRDEVVSYAGRMYVFEDVSLRKRATTAVSAAQEAAFQATRAKSALLAGLSQELRHPLRHLVETATLLLGTALNTQQRHYAGSILTSGEKLQTLSEKISEFLQIEAGKLDDSDVEIDIYQLVGDVAESLAGVAHQKRLELAWWIEPDIPPILVGKGGRLREVLTRLLSNALRFTDAGEVCVQAIRESEEGEQTVVRFAVRDTGVGITPEQQQRLFTLAPDGGGGLGLLICKQLVESAGGAIGVDSQPGRGSTFWFSMPLAQPPARPPQGLPGEGDALRRHRIMIVDDNATMRSILDRQLDAWLIPHEAMASGREALTRLRAAADYGAPYDLAIIDAQMPEMDGLDLARAIRQEPKLAQLPLVLLTVGEPVPPEVTEQLGISATLSKPVRPVRLHACLAAVVLASMMR